MKKTTPTSTQGSKTLKSGQNKASTTSTSTSVKDMKDIKPKESKPVSTVQKVAQKAAASGIKVPEVQSGSKAGTQVNKLVQNGKLAQLPKKPVSKATKLTKATSASNSGMSTDRSDRSDTSSQKTEIGSDLAIRPQTLSTKRYEIIFNNYLVHLLNKLHELEQLGYSEVKENLDHCFLKYSKLVDNGRIQEYLQHVHERFQPHIKLIAEQDDFLFATDYNQGDLRLISGLDLYNIWQTLDTLEHSLEFEEDEAEREKCKDLADKALNLKKVIWKSLTNLYVSSCLALGRTDDTWAISIMKNLRLAKQLEKEIEEEPDDEEEAGGAGFGLPNIADFEKIFNSDNPLSQIINDVRNEINPEEYMRALNPENKPPLEVIMGLFSGQNKEGLQSVATSLGMKFEDKMKQRGLTEDDLKNAADGMKKDLSKIPGIGMLLSQFDTDAAKASISVNLAGGTNAGVSSDSSNVGASEHPTHNMEQSQIPMMAQPTPEQTEMLQNVFKDIHEKMQKSNPQEDAIPIINNLFASLNANIQLPQQLNYESLEKTQEQQQVDGNEIGQDNTTVLSVTTGFEHIPSDLPPDPITQMLETMKKMHATQLSDLSN